MLYRGIRALRQSVRQGFSSFFTNERCICCGKQCGAELCAACMEEKVFRFVPPGIRRCSVCGKVLQGEEGLCLSCRERRVLHSPDAVFPLHAYRLWNKNLLFRWKMSGARVLSAVFAEALYRALCVLYSENAGNVGNAIPPIVPVPPRPGKIRRQGWDQIAEVCTCLRRRHGLAVLPLLERLSDDQQKKKNRAERLKFPAVYAASRFALRARCPVPAEVVLVDDLVTTGATVECCARRLKELGIRKVQVLSLFIVD